MPLETVEPACSEADRLRFRAEFVDDVLSKLGGALLDRPSFTSRDLAGAIGLHEREVVAILNGERENFGIETLALVARGLGLRPELVLHDTKHEGPMLSSGAATSVHSGDGGEARRRQSAAMEELIRMDADELDEPTPALVDLMCLHQEVEDDRRRQLGRMEANDAVGEVIASFMRHDTLDHYRRERDERIPLGTPGCTGHYEGCLAEADEFIARLAKRGWNLVPAEAP